MIAKGVSLRYSKALVDIATNPEQIKSHLLALEEFVGILETIPKLKELLFDPHLSTLTKKSILQRLFKDRLDETILNFLFVLIEKNRFKYIVDIRKEYHRLAKKRLGILEVRLLTAVSVSDTLQEKVRIKLQKTYQKEVEIQNVVNPDIVGGMILIMDHQIFDNSVKKKLAKLKVSLLTAKV
ncbi:ATP synthase F1 subunit delta [Candidatus Protochlamydia amoebophila]|uniref:ATP synthase subunit delta n=1 Tax=Candidatus Protochlamydia amoebophila TaxID=362787 RepID=A0A0C1JKD8_9BACT|nr:ATP synthase F1 subunit delta [Candidatus Protochlamydia amoebophila]KIC71755.1 ATP synthase subunit delta [Candidatus Protochlamydia amoebophila]